MVSPIGKETAVYMAVLSTMLVLFSILQNNYDSLMGFNINQK
jgi:hypothetical protein